MPQLTLHIGTERTGSSTIQRGLAINKVALRDQGLAVISGGSEANPGKLRMNIRDLDDEGWIRIERGLDRARAEGTDVVISNEVFWRTGVGQPFQHLAALANGFDVRVVCYVREQAEYLQSMLLHNHKKVDRLVDLSEPEHLATILKRRNLDYLQLSRSVERDLGRGTVSARLYGASWFRDGGLWADFCGELRRDPASLDPPLATGSGLAAVYADVLRTNWTRWRSDYSYGDLLDLSLLLSSRESVDRWFLTEPQAMVLRARYEQSNTRFARRYLTNADQVPTSAAWSDHRAELGPLADELQELADRFPRLGRGWRGSERAGRRIFASGWTTHLAAENQLRALPTEDATLRFRLSYQQRHRRPRGVALTLLGTSDGDYTPVTTINGQSLGRQSPLEAPLVIPNAMIGELDEIVVQLRSSDHANVEVNGLELRPLD